VGFLEITVTVIIMYFSVRLLHHNVQGRICCWYFCLFKKKKSQKQTTNPKQPTKTSKHKEVQMLKKDVN